MSVYHYTMEHVNEKNREDFLGKLNRLGAYGIRVIQIMDFTERLPENKEDEDAFCAGTLLIESPVMGRDTK